MKKADSGLAASVGVRGAVRIIALDLDGTLLDSNKELSKVNRDALQRAADAGIEIVPTTGRFYDAIPEVVRKLPFVRYAITINGAHVADIKTGEVIYTAELPWRQTVDIMALLDGYPVIYDCYQDNMAWMTGEHKNHIDRIVSSPHYRVMLRELRRSVPELKAFLTERQKNVQKMQFFTDIPELRTRMLKELPERFENICVSSSLPDNVEVNRADANKGAALFALADHLGVDRKATMSFGDGLNDLTMLKAAGIGVAMANAEDEVKAAADVITLSCDEDGVAYGINKYCFCE